MRDKLRAIWRIVFANEYLLIASTGISASYGKNNMGEIIRKVVNLIPKEMMPKDSPNKKLGG